RSAEFSGGYILAENEIEMMEDFTISFWINPAYIERENAYMAVLSKQIEVYLTKNNKLSINLKNPDESFNSTSALDVDMWSHVVLRKDGDEFTIFINGHKNKDKKIGTLTDNGLDTIMIGKTDWDGAELFAGKLDELKFYTSALSSTKLNEIYQNELSGKNDDASARDEVICLSPIGCVDNAIVIDDSKFVFEVDLATGLNTRFEIDASAGGINGFGFNKKDGYIWGYNQTKKDGTLLRVGKTKEGAYAQEVFGPIDALKGKSFYIGDIDDDGQLYLYGGGTIYIVDIDANSNTFLSVLDSFSVGSISVADMAFNPIDKLLYAIESDNDLYLIDLENKKTKLLKSDVIETSTDTFGSSFFDSAGFFYAIKNSSRYVYRIDLSDRENIRALKFSSLPNADVKNVNIDGGRCSDRPIYIDYGDAPDGSAYDSGDGTDTLNYKTLTSDNGARHKILVDKPNVFFGDGNVALNVSSESDAKVGNLDDDNGLVGGLNPLFTSTHKYSLKFAVQNDTNKSANVVGWIDFNRNGRFEMDEGTSTSVFSENRDVVTLKWNVPDDIQEGTTYARFRVSTDDMATLESDSYGIKTDGEVEDYEIIIKRGSLYDAWDLDSNLSSRTIQTKIVNEDISLKIAAVSRDGESIIDNTFTNIKAGLFSKDDGSTLHDFVDINFTQANPYTVDFGKIARANRYSYVKISYLDELNVTREVNATDAFAIRPKRYDMSIQAPDGLVAGRDFNITIKALDALGATVVNYDENVSVYGLDYNETLIANGCVRGVLTAPKVVFSQGVATIVSRYDNVGQLDLKAYEIKDADTEFAVVDKDDGSNEDRYIEDDALQTGKFSPSSIAMNWDFKNGSSAYTFYDSNLSEMAAPLYVAIKAQDENNVTVTNFRDGCYAEDVTVKIDFDIEGVAQSLTPQSDATVSYAVPLTDITTNTFSFKVLKGDFVDGEGNETVRMNFQRERNKALEPMKFTITDINTTTTGGIYAGDGEDKVATFVYLRAHVTDQSVIGKIINAHVDYEVYSKDSNRALFGLENASESRDDINWYIINSDINMDYSDEQSTFDTGITVAHTSRNEIAIEVEKLPHSNIIRYRPSFEYLLYDRYNAMIKEHHFKVRFNPEEPKWTGKGDLGKTIDFRAYKGNGLQKIDW
ncbi:MAG TPA: LamG domain-containing protein, partial [Sulfurimonas sp.]|nr:LamG domain-containing protein [Sulfurimonas sp.]